MSDETEITKGQELKDLEYKTNYLKEIVVTCKSAGWKNLSEWMKEKIDSYCQELINCPDNKLNEIRAMIKAYRTLLEIGDETEKIVSENESIIRELKTELRIVDTEYDKKESYVLLGG
ncbi:MAG: hypothetical protein QME51_00800 [Planctomycetota bacterium]|nr:hypothetical protein [Planctomycetota bacterium]